MKQCVRCGGSGSEPDNAAIGKRMRSKRVKAGIGLRTMAEKVGLSPSYIVNLEYGLRTWNADLIKKYNQITK